MKFDFDDLKHLKQSQARHQLQEFINAAVEYAEAKINVDKDLQKPAETQVSDLLALSSNPTSSSIIDESEGVSIFALNGKSESAKIPIK